MARGLKFGIYEIEGLYFLCSENKGTVTAKLICVFVFAYAKIRFSHVVAHFSDIIYLYLSDFCSGEFPLRLGAWDGLCYFIMALPGPSI